MYVVYNLQIPYTVYCNFILCSLYLVTYHNSRLVSYVNLNSWLRIVLQETYRRWACSTMVPLWVEEGAEEGSEEGGRARRAPAEHAARWHARHLERVGHLDRRRGAGAGGVVGRWVRAAAAGPGRPIVRLKPCLSVCQLVEQHCPYFLPADRAPAYPTQYAGEPTFLCLGRSLATVTRWRLTCGVVTLHRYFGDLLSKMIDLSVYLYSQYTHQSIIGNFA